MVVLKELLAVELVEVIEFAPELRPLSSGVLLEGNIRDSAQGYNGGKVLVADVPLVSGDFIYLETLGGGLC